MNPIKEELFGGFFINQKLSSRIKKFPGDFESLLRCEITIAPGSGKQQVWVKPPIALTF